MKHLKYILLSIALILMSSVLYSQEDSSQSDKFDKENDLLLAHFDCKTDVDDLHSMAALATILANDEYSVVNYYAVAGAYGTQGGLYVPPNELMTKAFGDNWSDAHADFEKAVDEVYAVAVEALQNGGDVWVAEAGQSDFTAALVKKIMSEKPEFGVSERFHVVQHSNWNEESTSTEDLQFVKENIQYHKIADGNAAGNGTACYRTEASIKPKEYLTNSYLKKVWKLAIKLANRYNGSEGRYNNEAVEKGGLDFSDVSEITWILEIDNADTVTGFFNSLR
ncbi:MAG: hypothetical protein PF486_06700 [Prolixibacteraceae bacterium]|jgi:hypothetical protein|nr:hypothetical protein [Prolixibacteraceae bacterium]